jgi:hypothetical protein
MVVIPTAAMREETMILRVRSVRARENINLQFPVAISNFQNSGSPLRREFRHVRRSDLKLEVQARETAKQTTTYETTSGKERIHNCSP